MLYGTSSCAISLFSRFFFFNDTATTEIYTLSLHDALPIWAISPGCGVRTRVRPPARKLLMQPAKDRKSTRLNSSHGYISYAVFCLKKKKRKTETLLPAPPLKPRSRATQRGRLPNPSTRDDT